MTYTVTVVDSGGNKYRFNGGSSNAETLERQSTVYLFDQSFVKFWPPLRFSTTSNGTHGGGTEYTTGERHLGRLVLLVLTRIKVATAAPTLYYYCTNHSEWWSGQHPCSYRNINFWRKLVQVREPTQVIQVRPGVSTVDQLNWCSDGGLPGRDGVMQLAGTTLPRSSTFSCRQT